MRRLGAVLLAGTLLLAGSPAAAQAATAERLATPTLHSATIDRTPPESAPGSVAIITLKFTAPLPANFTMPPDYAVWAEDRVVAMTSFPHNVDPQNGFMTVEMCEGPDGSTGSCNLWAGDPPRPIPMTGDETFTITQHALGFEGSAHSNGLVPTEVD
ncbi:hypothetical protein [Actinomadura sp. HBU206391]|uniref:hypothetical protein n=1 Tax=Actinomadura sp. HBU206391 TaxID=2731692 RepID=UPI0016507357|nr:hypothetical protein [Actinomadura sp. HBU206391]MBC6461458.1 hypothetical protein [Actinomadura sp. HBU206391]